MRQTNNNKQQPFIQDDLSELVPEKTLTHNSPFSAVHSIFLAYLSDLTIFFYNLTPTVFFDLPLGVTPSNSKSIRFSINHSHAFLKHAHTILTYVAVPLQLYHLCLVSLS